MVDKETWQRRGQLAFGFIKYFIARCFQDRITITAGHLTYVSSLALVPLVVVTFSGFAAFPMFEDVREELQNMLFDNLVPTSSEVIQEYLNEFAANASQMTTIGVMFIIVVAIMLLVTIDTTINRIWRNNKRRRLPIAIAIYWMLLTLGPVLIGSGLAASSYLLSFAAMANEYVSGFRQVVLTMLPFITSVLAFLLLYVLMPNREVRIKHAIWGALLATILFELSKAGFAEYISRFPSYEAIYGALATIPILLVWMYLSWIIVLVGAELTASIEEFDPDYASPANSDKEPD